MKIGDILARLSETKILQPLVRRQYEKGYVKGWDACERLVVPRAAADAKGES